MISPSHNYILKHLLRVTVIILLVGIFSGSCLAQSLESKVDQYLAPYVTLGNFSGSVLIAQGDKVLLSKGYGLANRELNIPNSSKTVFRLGSLSKQFTALAIMQLEEKKLLTVSDPLSKYIPDYPNGDTITLHHLLTHTSGIKDFTGYSDYHQTSILPTTLEQTITKFKNQPLAFTPGEKISYSNSNYILLSYILEKVSGQTYEQYVKQHIFDPLGMKNTGYDHYKPLIANRASGYKITDSGMVNADYMDMSIPSGAGALHSTVEDMYLWDRALYTEKLLTKRSLGKMFTPVSVGTAGYGFFIDEQYKHKQIHHSGGINGFETNIARFVTDNAVIIVLNNVENSALGQIQVDLAAILFGEKYEIPSFKEIPLDAKFYDSYTGKYQVSPTTFITVTKETDGLYAALGGLEKAKLYPLSEAKFFQKVNDFTATFTKDNSGKITGLTYRSAGQTNTALKVQ